MDPHELLIECEEGLHDVGCQFWACDGPTLKPVQMATCRRCALLGKVRKHLGLPISGDEAESLQDKARDRYNPTTSA